LKFFLFSLDIPQSSTPVILQTQSQPTTMLTSQQQQMVQNSHLLPQPSLSFSYSTIPPSQHVLNNTIPNDTIKQVVHPPPPSSSSFSAITSTTTETIDNSHLSISPSPTPLSVPHTSEAVQPSLPSDAQQPQVR
jgi:hypothetical protein